MRKSFLYWTGNFSNMIARIAILCAALIAVSAVHVPGHLHYAKAPLPYAAVPYVYPAVAKAPLAYAPIVKAAPLAYAPVVKAAPLAYAAPYHPVHAHAPLAYTGLLGPAHYGYGHGYYAPRYAKVGYGKVLW